MGRVASSPPSSSSSSTGSPRPQPCRPPRKSTAVARREEKVVLLQELEVLRSWLRLYRQRQRRQATSTTDSPIDIPEFDEETVGKASTYLELRRVVRDRHLQLAKLHGLVCAHTASQQFEPLHERLCLSEDHIERRETLRLGYPQKIRDAETFMLARCTGLDLTMPYSSQAKFQDPKTGELVVMMFDITQFPDIQNVHRVYEALRFWSSNLEICVSEKLGNVTIREDMEEDEIEEMTADGEAYISVRSIHSTVPSGVTARGVQAVFAQVFDVGNQNERVVLTVQPVASDALHADHKTEDVKAAANCVMRVTMEKDTVVLSRWVKLRFRPNHTRDRHVATPHLHAVMNSGIGRWFEVFERVMWEQLYNTPPPFSVQFAPQLPL